MSLTPLHLNPRPLSVPRASDGRWYSDGRLVFGEIAEQSWAAWPINPDGFLAGKDIQNEDATYRITGFSPTDAQKRWGFFDGGAFIFSSTGATPGVYEAFWEINDADGQGNSLAGTVSVTVDS